MYPRAFQVNVKQDLQSIGHIFWQPLWGHTTQELCHVVKSLQLTWRWGTRRWNLRVPHLQMSCSDLTYRQVTWNAVLVRATKVTCPIGKVTCPIGKVTCPIAKVSCLITKVAYTLLPRWHVLLPRKHALLPNWHTLLTRWHAILPRLHALLLSWYALLPRWYTLLPYNKHKTYDRPIKNLGHQLIRIEYVNTMVFSQWETGNRIRLHGKSATLLTTDIIKVISLYAYFVR